MRNKTYIPGEIHTHAHIPDTHIETHTLKNYSPKDPPPNPKNDDKDENNKISPFLIDFIFLNFYSLKDELVMLVYFMIRDGAPIYYNMIVTFRFPQARKLESEIGKAIGNVAHISTVICLDLTVRSFLAIRFKTFSISVNFYFDVQMLPSVS